MTRKRALIVDDSKSARSFLSRILEGYALEVDTVESAEEAIEYLTRHIPDVIFMDHLMPGMDGFQAVHTIKENPRTATIPIMMYTSQEGELYLGQARALGAIGVLPKQIKPADVSKVLYQLHLVPDRRIAAQETFQPVQTTEDLVTSGQTAEGLNMSAEVALAASSSSPAVVNEMLVRDQISELRRFVVSNLEQQSERVLDELRSLLRDMQIAAPPSPPEPLPQAREPERPAAAWAIAAVAVLAAVAMAGLWRGEMLARESLQARLTAREAAAEPTAGASLPGALAATGAGVGDSQLSATADDDATGNAGVVQPVPYGELPLSGARVELARDILAQLLARGFRGVVNVAAYPGRFCLSGNAAEGYSLAPDDVRFENCDLLSNPTDEAPQRESLAFANMIAEMRKRAAGAIDIQVGSGTADGMASAYPRVSAGLTAGEWNTAAAANNRVEIRWRSRS